jgi:hypothetical protein
MKTQLLLASTSLAQVQGGFAPLNLAPDWWQPTLTLDSAPTSLPPTLNEAMDRLGFVADL